MFAAFACAVLAGCDYLSSVRRTASPPVGFDPVLAVAALADHPQRSARDEVPGEPIVVLRDGPANAWFAWDARAIEVFSFWASVPDAAVLDRSLQLQNEIIERLRSRWPTLCAPDAWQAEWIRRAEPVPSREAMLGELGKC
jgi:hypothetical protein